MGHEKCAICFKFRHILKNPQLEPKQDVPRMCQNPDILAPTMRMYQQEGINQPPDNHPALPRALEEVVVPATSRRRSPFHVRRGNRLLVTLSQMLTFLDKLCPYVKKKSKEIIS